MSQIVTSAALPPGVIFVMSAAVMAFLGYWLAWAAAEKISLAGALVKTVSTGALAVAGALQEAPAYAIAGLALGALGDFFLARRNKKAFLAGMGAFALGHLAYAAGMTVQGASLAPFHLSTPQIVTGALLILVLLTNEVWLIPRTGALRWPVRAYGLVIGLMGLGAVALPAHPENLSAALIQLGAGLFILSDILLALRLFVVPAGPRARALSLALWPAYWAGQALILLGASLYALPFGA